MKEEFSRLWSVLSPSARELAKMMATIQPAFDQKYLQVISPLSNLEAAINDLLNVGLIEATSYIEERRKVLSELSHIAAAALANLGAEAEATDEEIRYLSAYLEVASYEQEPEKHQGWEVPKYQLKEQYREFVLQQK